MTVITKPLTEKKSNKLKEPLVENGNIQTGIPNPDVEAGDEPRYVIVGAQAKRVSTATTICLFLTALLVMSIGVIGGVYLYRQFARSHMPRYEGWCRIPYGKPLEELIRQESLVGESDHFDSDDIGLEANQQLFNKARPYFEQDFTLDLEEELYEEIKVPDFRGGRKGRFIHDFYSNKTGIVDIEGRRCFVMPLDRERVLPPRSMLDLLGKMQNGYYDVDTEVVRRTMRVVVPPTTDFKNIGQFITKECEQLQTYMLEEETINSKIFKRSAPSQALFTEFAGSKISELFINTEALEQYEKEHSSI